MTETHCLESCELIAPVTALEFVDTELFIGEGPYLSIYETTNGSRVTIEKIFHNQRIHCIKVSDMNSPTTIVVCGGKAVSVLNFQQCLSRRKLSVNRTTFLSDWIWDICLLNSPLEQGLQVALATGHNTVWLWNIKNDEKVQLSRCEEQCILYCARFIGRILDQMWLACGTVFNEVLLWKITNKKSNDELVRVSKRLTGHDGVIFSIRYDEGKQILCSVSDDRSIKVWRLVCSLEDSLKVTAEPFLVLYGHKARVWDCLIMKKYIVSIGEDSTCLVWNFDGEIIKKFKGHIGKSIWSLAAHQNEQIISTGGGDGGVRLLSLNDKEGNIQEQHSFSAIPQDEATSQPNWDIPRSLAFLPNNNVLVMTDKGNFYSYSCFQDVDKNSPTGTWDFLQNERDYCSYSLMALSPCRKIIALGNIYGNMKLWSAIDPSCSPLEMKPYNDKVLSLHWITGNEKVKEMNLFSCGPDGCLIWWTINCLDGSRDFVCEVKSYFRLPYCRQRWANSIFVAPMDIMCSEMRDQFDASSPLVLCGDRRGSLHIFKAGNTTEPMDPLHSHIGIHGRNGVTHITSNRGLVYTAGRDGYFRQYKFCGTNLELVNKQKVYKGLEWIERLNFTSESDLLVMGFHTVDFVTWSMQRNEILLRIPCGGGHRIWDLLITESEKQATTMFTYLKKQAVHVHKFSEMKVSHTPILQDSFHGREATCVRFIRSLESENQGEQFCLLATGSEDTNINITAYYPTSTQKRFRKLFTCQGHISSVRCLALMRANHVPVSDEYNFLLFSGGGRAALKCWSVSLSNMVRNESSPVLLKPDKSSHSICTLLTELPEQVSRYRRKRVQRQVMEGSFCDIRFMSVSVFSLSDILPLDWCNTNISSPVCGVITGCSDGHLRFYVMDSKIKNMKLIGQCSWNEKCLLCVGHFLVLLSIQHRLVVYAADTAGRISFWDFTDLFTDYFCNTIHDEQNTVSNESLPIKSELPVSGDKVNVEIGLDSSHSSIPRQRDCVESCLDAQAEGVCSTKPFYSRSLHQSGVNAVSLVPRDSGQYLLCSGGDDGALMVALFEIRVANGSLAIHSWREVSVPNAHTSSTTGVKILEDRFVLSASVDQRLKLWKIIIDEHSEMSIQLNENHFVDVADIQDIDVQRNRDGSYHIVVCGVGLQMLTLKKTYQ